MTTLRCVTIALLLHDRLVKADHILSYRWLWSTYTFSDSFLLTSPRISRYLPVQHSRKVTVQTVTLSSNLHPKSIVAARPAAITALAVEIKSKKRVRSCCSGSVGRTGKLLIVGVTCPTLPSLDNKSWNWRPSEPHCGRGWSEYASFFPCKVTKCPLPRDGVPIYCFLAGPTWMLYVFLHLVIMVTTFLSFARLTDQSLLSMVGIYTILPPDVQRDRNDAIYCRTHQHPRTSRDPP